MARMTCTREYRDDQHERPRHPREAKGWSEQAASLPSSNRTSFSSPMPSNVPHILDSCNPRFSARPPGVTRQTRGHARRTACNRWPSSGPLFSITRPRQGTPINSAWSSSPTSPGRKVAEPFNAPSSLHSSKVLSQSPPPMPSGRLSGRSAVP